MRNATRMLRLVGRSRTSEPVCIKPPPADAPRLAPVRRYRQGTTDAGKNRGPFVARDSLPVRGCAGFGAGQHRILPRGQSCYAIPDSVDARAGGIDGEVDLK